MRQRCEFCGGWIDDTYEFCPHCGGVNARRATGGTNKAAAADATPAADGAAADKPAADKPAAGGSPKTIEELRDYCTRHNLPLDQMRFFIGEDYRKPKAFGIYRDGDEFVVYKNKADGSRAIRYRGKDEAHAVNELYQKMRSEIALRRGSNTSGQASGTSPKSASTFDGRTTARRRRWIAIIIAILATALLSISACVHALLSGPMMGYYTYNGTQYYYVDDTWYRYDTEVRDWRLDTNPPEGLTQSGSDYWESYSYHDDYEATDFDTTDYAKERWGTSDDTDTGTTTGNNDNSWSWDDDDDDWSWDDDDSWDSDLTDWDDDW